MKEEENLLAHIGREGVAGGQPQEPDQVLVAVHDPLEELLPQGALGRVVVRDRAELGEHVFAPMRAQLSGPQVECSVQAVQGPRIAVQILRLDGYAWLT